MVQGAARISNGFGVRSRKLFLIGGNDRGTMRRFSFFGICVMLTVVLCGCETVSGVSRDIGNTARNIRDVLGVGKEIRDIAR